MTSRVENTKTPITRERAIRDAFKEALKVIESKIETKEYKNTRNALTLLFFLYGSRTTPRKLFNAEVLDVKIPKEASISPSIVSINFPINKLSIYAMEIFFKVRRIQKTFFHLSEDEIKEGEATISFYGFVEEVFCLSGMDKALERYFRKKYLIGTYLKREWKKGREGAMLYSALKYSDAFKDTEAPSLEMIKKSKKIIFNGTHQDEFREKEYKYKCANTQCGKEESVRVIGQQKLRKSIEDRRHLCLNCLQRETSMIPKERRGTKVKKKYQKVGCGKCGFKIRYTEEFIDRKRKNNNVILCKKCKDIDRKEAEVFVPAKMIETNFDKELRLKKEMEEKIREEAELFLLGDEAKNMGIGIEAADEIIFLAVQKYDLSEKDKSAKEYIVEVIKA